MKATIAEITTRISVKPNKTDGIQNYDIDNAYPQRIRNAIKASGRTTQCVNLFWKFIRGKGFADPFFKVVVNPNKRLTVDKLNRKVTKDYSHYYGFAMHFNYNLNGKIVTMDHVPFEELRLGIEDEKTGIPTVIKHHPDWGREFNQRLDKEKITPYNLFDPNPNTVLKQMSDAGGIGNYRGQILWWSANGWKYPEASCDPVLEDVVADDEAKQFRLNNIASNFLSPMIAETEEYTNDDDRNAFKKNLKNLSGARHASRIMHVEKKKGAPGVEIKKLEIQSMDGLFKETENSSRESIRSNYSMLPVFLGDLVSGKLGTKDEIRDAVDFANNFLFADDRMIFEEIFSEIFQYWHVPNANPTGNYQIMPLSYGDVAAA